MNEDSQAKAIQDIVKNVNTGDTLYIDLSGGMRDTAMLLVAVARYLRDLRDVNAHVRYTEMGGRQVLHCTRQRQAVRSV